MKKKKNQSPIRIVSTILGSFFLAFLAFGLMFTFGIKSSSVSAEARRLVENLGTEPAIDVLHKLVEQAQKAEAEASTGEIIVDVSIGGEGEKPTDTEEQPSQMPSEGETQPVDATVAPTVPTDIINAMIVEWNKQLDAQTVTNLTQNEQVEVHKLFANTIFFGDSMAQAIGDYGFMDKANVIFQRSATVDVLLNRTTEVAACLPERVIIFTGLNDCNHYADSQAYRADYGKLIDSLRNQIPGVQICVTSLLPPSNELAATRPDLARAPIFDMELRTLCAEKQVMYIDSTWIVRQENYIKDGIHMNRTFYRIWFRYLKVLLG